MRSLIRSFFAAALLAQGAMAADAPRFEDLPAEAQAEFAMFKDKWEIMRPQVLAAWSQWQTLTPEDKNLTRKAMLKWSKMTAAERRQAERALEKLKRLSPEKQKELMDDVAAAAQNSDPKQDRYEQENTQMRQGGITPYKGMTTPATRR